MKSALIGGELNGEQARAVRTHLAGCAACASKLHAIEWMEVLPVLDEEIEPSPDFAARFRAKLEAERLERSPKDRSIAFRWTGIAAWGWTQRVAAAGVLAALAVAGIFLGRSASDMPDPSLPYSELAIAEKLPLLQDMAIINNLELLENFDAIENLTLSPKDSGRRRNP